MGTNIIYFYALLIYLFSACSGNNSVRHEFEHLQMGTKFHLSIYGDDYDSLKSVATKAFEKLDSLNNIFTDFSITSELSDITFNDKVGLWQQVSNDMWQLLKIAQEVNLKSNGSFDVTVGPLTRIWRKAFRRQEMPDSAAIRNAILRLGPESLEIDNYKRRVKILKENMRLDAGGIAKGYVIDKMAELLEDNGYNCYMIDGGGDIRVGNAPPGTKGWKIELINGKMMNLSDRAIVTSGDTYNYLVWKGKRYSHLIDPKTGYGIQDSKVVTILSSLAVQADVWASALSVMNESEISNARERGFLNGLEIILIEDNSSVYNDKSMVPQQ